MEPVDPKKLSEHIQDLAPEEQLSVLFGSYKAEWLREQLFDLFAQPSYFPELTTPRPCMLVGGRGTGKTTVLRCLSYDGQFALSGKRAETVPDWPYYGVYYRVNTNRVTAFKGPELSDDRWKRVFAHYFNLIICDRLVEFLQWYHKLCPTQHILGEEDCASVAKSLHLESAHSVNELAQRIADGKIRFEAYINNIANSPGVALSIQGAPLDVLVERLLNLPSFKGKGIFLLLDEYENFEDYQQEVVNTLIKHSGSLYTFKIGVRELGLRRKSTLNASEQLVHPADYVRVDIRNRLDGERFKTFAAKVCNDRLACLQLPTGHHIPPIQTLLPGLTEDEEANIQGVRELSDDIVSALIATMPSVDLTFLKSLPPLQVYFLKFWATGKDIALESAYEDFLENRSAWEVRYANYKHALLFTLRRRKRGIQKYYCGWDVFTQIAGGNIRYLLELVDQSLLFHLRGKGIIGGIVDAATQTRAAQFVGRQNLSELEGLSIHGAQLTKLLLGLGRIFQTLAAEPEGHTPEITQFHISDAAEFEEYQTGSAEPEIKRLLRSAVMHLALVRTPGNKLGNEADTKDYDYMVHPIFCAFFSYSYRKKRKMMLTAQQLMGLVHKPRVTIRDILSQNNRATDEPLPEQMNLFSSFFNDDK